MKHIVLLAFLGFLAGCSSSKGLECPMGEGMPCHSLGQVSDRLDAEGALQDPTIVHVVDRNI